MQEISENEKIRRQKISETLKIRLADPALRQKMSEALKKRVRSDKEKERLKKGMHYKIPHSEETKLKLKEAWKTRPPCSDATRKKVSERVTGEKHPMFGKHPSEETRRKQRESHLGKTYVPSVKQLVYLKAGIHRVPHSEETKRKLSESKKGEKSPNWQGGKSFEPYCPKFDARFKERVRTFFGHQCMFPGCGHIWKKGEKKLAVHHVNYQKQACCDKKEKPLFVPICSEGCHIKTNNSREYWEQYFSELIAIQYGGKCYFTEDEMQKREKSLCYAL